MESCGYSTDKFELWRVDDTTTRLTVSMLMQEGPPGQPEQMFAADRQMQALFLAAILGSALPRDGRTQDSHRWYQRTTYRAPSHRPLRGFQHTVPRSHLQAAKRRSVRGTEQILMSERTVYSFVFAKPRSEPDNPSEHEGRIEYREINVES